MAPTTVNAGRVLSSEEMQNKGKIKAGHNLLGTLPGRGEIWENTGTCTGETTPHVTGRPCTKPQGQLAWFECVLWGWGEDEGTVHRRKE